MNDTRGIGGTFAGAEMEYFRDQVCKGLDVDKEIFAKETWPTQKEIKFIIDYFKDVEFKFSNKPGEAIPLKYGSSAFYLSELVWNIAPVELSTRIRKECNVIRGKDWTNIILLECYLMRGRTVMNSGAMLKELYKRCRDELMERIDKTLKERREANAGGKSEKRLADGVP